MKKNLIRLFTILIYFIIMLNLIYKDFNSNDESKVRYVLDTSMPYSEKIVIDIPKISLKEYIKKASNNFSNLDNSLVYYKTFNPNDKIVIFGHSGMSYGSYFSRIDELKKQDISYIYFKGNIYEYEVNNISTISKYSTYVLDKEKNSNKLVLITCDKKYKDKRLMIELYLKNIKTL